MTDTTDGAAPPAAGAPGGGPRLGLSTAVTLAGATLAAIAAEQLAGPTPRTEYSVGQLARHLISALRRVAVSGPGGDPATVSQLAEDVPDTEFSPAWETSARGVSAMLAEPGVLAREMQLPFATLPGAAALAVFTTELTIHTWDLATATGQRPQWDATVVANCVAGMRRLPAEPRAASCRSHR